MEPGTSARLDPGRYFSTVPALIPGATSQEAVRFQHAPNLPSQSMFQLGNGSGSEQDAHTWAQHSCQSRAADAQPRAHALLCSSLCKNRGIFSTSLHLTDKHQNFTAKISHSLPKGGRGTSRSPAHTSTCVSGAGGSFWEGFANEAQRCPSFGSRQGLKSRPTLWPSVQERQETPALPSKAQVSPRCTEVKPPKIYYGETSSGSSFKSSWSSFSSCSSFLDFSWTTSPGVFKNLNNSFCPGSFLMMLSL